jgi:hypothetical protein
MTATRPRAGIVAPLAVAVVVVAVTWGSGWTVTGAAAAPIDVASGLSVRTPEGWSATTAALPPPWRGVRLVRGPEVVTVAGADGVGGSPVDVLDAYVQEVLPAQVQVSVFGEVGSITLPSGRQAVTFGYLGTSSEGIPLEGLAIAFLGGPGGVVFDAVAPKGELGAIADDLRSLVGSAEVA